MNNKLGIFVCDCFIKETKDVIRQSGNNWIECNSFPSQCGHPKLHTSQVEKLNTCHPSLKQFIYIGNSCLPDKSISPNKENCQFHKLEQCFELFLNHELVNFYLLKGYYLATPCWLDTFDERIEKWGFNIESASIFFKESTKKFLLLDTGIDDHAEHKMKSIALRMDLPYEVLPVGLSHYRLYINDLICQSLVNYEKVAQNEQLARITRQSADYKMVFNQVDSIVKLQNEKEILEQVNTFLSLLFDPVLIYYSPLIQGKEGATVTWENRNPQEQETVNSENSFVIFIKHQNEDLGTLSIQQISFPQFINHYKQLSVVIGDILGLAIDNARKFERIADSERKLQDYSALLAESLKTKDRFLSLIGHDLRNPIGSLVSFLELLIERYPTYSDEKKLEILNSVLKSAQNVYQLLDNLLQWKSSQNGKIVLRPENVIIERLIRDTAESIYTQLQNKQIEFYLDIETPITLKADSQVVGTVIRNLISNAIKFTVPGGKVRVSTKVINEKVHISVTDTGVGIRPEILKKLFKVSEQVKTPGTLKEPGTGLGLLLCKELVELHGGKIWVENTSNLGSTFTFSLPGVLSNVNSI